jgi:hypothetical protein
VDILGQILYDKTVDFGAIWALFALLIIVFWQPKSLGGGFKLLNHVATGFSAIK